MKFLVQKIDYQLYSLIFKENNLDAAHEVWQSILNNEAFLNIAIQFDEKGKSKYFVAPTIVFLILNNPNLLPVDIYLKLVDKIFNNIDIVLNFSYFDVTFDYILMILRNNSLKLNSKNKQKLLAYIYKILNVGGITESVQYNSISNGKDILATFNRGNTTINLDELEYDILTNQGHIDIVKQKILVSKLREYYFAIFNNPSFLEDEKDTILKRIQNIYLLVSALSNEDEVEVCTTRLAI